MTDSTAKERKARWRENQKIIGLVRVEEWVPKECVETLRRIAAEMRDKK
jgi:hypothetical protein